MRAIVFVLRGCSAGWLGAYGNEWVATPNLDRFAAEAVVFDRQISDCPDPVAAGQAWLHGTRLLEELHAADARTVLVRANHPGTDAPASFYAGWSEVFDARPHDGDAAPLDNLLRSLPSVLDKLATVPRWLLWVEIDRLLPPWDVPRDVFEAYIAEDEEDHESEGADDSEEPIEPFRDPPTGPFDKLDLAAWRRLHATVASAVTALDAELGSAFDELRTRGLDQTAAWLVASDLGYPLGEHGQIGVHRPWLHEELVHLPLLLRLPGAVEAGRRVPGFTQPSDIAPTLLNLFGIEGRFPGHSLLPLAHGEAEAIRPYAFSKLECNGASEIAIRTEAWAYLQPIELKGGDPPRSPMLFARPDDRWEMNDVAGQHEDIVEELHILTTTLPK